MSAPAEMDAAYQRFLVTSDLASWMACAAAFGHLLEADATPPDATPFDVRRALTLGQYVVWMAHRHGDHAARERFRGFVHRLGARVPQVDDRREATLLQVVLTASRGYHATARHIARGLDAPMPVEIALLTMPDRTAARAATVLPYVGDPAACFVPALYFYGSALFELGYLSRVHDLLDACPAGADTALARDLRGQLCELDGAWAAARAQYAGSPWASHIYRRAVCDLILGEPMEHLARWPEADIAAFSAGMLDFSDEIDRAGVVRSASFVRACRWSGFDNWLVHFELGRLGFQRRRHSEAERHFAAAAATAPEPFRFAVLSLRFSNLTWLESALSVDVEGETLEAGHAALAAPVDEESRTYIRTWMASRDRSRCSLDSVLAGVDPYQRALAHQQRSNLPAATADFGLSLRTHTPRALQQLVRTFATWGFEQTAHRLATIAAREAEGSFFHTLELAETLGAVIAKLPGERHTRGLLGAVLADAERRLEELVGAEFQNALRAFRHFLQRRQPAPVRRMLACAERLAEGAEELLLLAIARRRLTDGGWDPRRLELLDGARRISRDRFERLVIARELALDGDAAGAHSILDEEEVLAHQHNLTPIEYALALRCTELCGDADEHRRLGEAAASALCRDIDAGRVAQYGDLMIARLNEHLETEVTVVMRPSVPSDEVSQWRQLVKELEALNGRRRSDQELQLLNRQVEAQADGEAVFAGLALWGLHVDRFDAQLRAIDRTRPVVGDDEVPLARDLAPVRVRARVLRQLWRECLEQPGTPADAALARIRQFRAGEQVLTASWDEARRHDVQGPGKVALRYANQGGHLLVAIAAADPADFPWPGFLELTAAVVGDARALAARLHERAAAMSSGGEA